jgi:hypothetical protein
MAAARAGRRSGAGYAVSAVDHYLAALRRELPLHPLYRRRVLAEVEDHLRESAAEHGEEEALARFGTPRDVAARFAPGAAASAATWASRALLLCLLGFAACALVTENLLPPAPWASAGAAPDFVRWTSAGFVWAFAAAAVLGIAALLRPRRVVLVPAAGALAAACLLAFANLVERARLYVELEAAGRIDPLAVVGAALYLGLLASAALGFVAWASLVAATARRASSS